jgi:GrpB-like predicted nucleotidyltransferase (UPF0157 family)
MEEPPRPDEADPTMARLRAATVGEVERRPVELSDPDPTWPAWFADQAARVRAALGPTALEIHHVGSTAVPGLPAKPILDMALVVPDPADEADYVPPLEAIGHELRIREPDWYQHRMLRPRATRDVHLHVFGPGCPEVARMLAFRDRLRSDPDDRALYARTKRELARRDWPTVQHYAEAKTAVVESILSRTR